MSTPTLNKPYCTIEQVQSEAKNTDPNDVDRFYEAVDMASRFIDDYCGRDFWLHDYTATALRVPHSWCAGNRMFVPWRVIQVDQVLIDGSVIAVGDYEIANPVDGPGGSIYLAGEWVPAGNGAGYSDAGVGLTRVFGLPRRIELNGKFGYTLANVSPMSTPPIDLPPAIGRAAVVIASVFSGHSRKEITGYDGNKQSIVEKTIPKDVMATLKRWSCAIV